MTISSSKCQISLFVINVVIEYHVKTQIAKINFLTYVK